MAKSSNYWDKRALERLSETEKMSELYIERIKKIYEQAYRDIDRQLASIYRNYAKDTGLDVQKLKELLTRSETKKTWEQMKRQGLDKYIKNNYKSRISRLEQIQAQIYAKAKLIYPKEELEQTMCYEGVINNSYYKAVYDTQMGTGYDFSFTKIDKNMTTALLNEKWSGLNYSQRIWGNTDILADSLCQIVGGAMLSGQSIEKTTKQIKDRFEVSKYYAERLVRTETNYFHNEADSMAYEELGIDKYVFVATLDSRTSEKCQNHDNKVYNYKDKETGVNFPPLHPNCRSKTRGYLGEEAEKNLKRRARNPISGKTEIIDNMSYKDWIKQYQIDISNRSTVKDLKERASNSKPAIDSGVINGKNIVGEWKRRHNEFEYDIEDIVNYQGYDGKPKVVEYEEFVKHMKESNFYAERTYSANSQEILDLYRDELYNGKWYIDCSTGGSQYGKGMYCASCYDIEDDKSMGGIGWEMTHYQLLNKEARKNPFYYTEGITLDKSAKVLILPKHEDTTYIKNLYNMEYMKKYCSDVQKEYVNSYIDAIEKMTELEKEINALGSNVDWTEMGKKLEPLKQQRDNSLKDGELNQLLVRARQNSYGKDPSTLAVELGYDVIKAEGHGSSGSYSVILNRTKVIFNKGGSIYGN